MAWYHKIWKPRQNTDPAPVTETAAAEPAENTMQAEKTAAAEPAEEVSPPGEDVQKTDRSKEADIDLAEMAENTTEIMTENGQPGTPTDNTGLQKDQEEEKKMQASRDMTAMTADPKLDALEPADVIGWFRKIAAIPHGSFHTKEISDFLEAFAKEHSLDYVRDEMGNLIISRGASAGCEKAAPIALQGHIDMVCEKEASNPIDMEKEAITLQTDGEWLWADRTTLGGDDGIAVAIMLALLADHSIKCPPLECVFTVDEEVGLLGADALDLSSLKSRRMVNLDSEEEGIITAACAGGAEEVCTLAGRRREKKGQVLEIAVSGLRGGHSGERIGAGRANADLVLARLLYRLEAQGKYCIISFNGGTRDNAIPRDARAELLFTGKKVRRGAVKAAVEAFAQEIAKEYSVTDPDIKIRAKWTGKDAEGLEKTELRIAFTRSDSRRMVRFLMALPNGVIEYSPIYREVPQTSLSLGIVKTLADGICTHSLVRSSVNSQKQMLMDRITCIAEEFGATVQTQGAYPAWELIEESSFRDLAAEVYWRLAGKKPTVNVIHGGLECGLLAAKVPGLDCISIGPDMEEVHTPAERLNIPSCARTYEYIRELLAACTE